MSQQPKPLRSTLSVDEVRKELGIGRPAAYELLKNGTIPSIRVGKKFIVTKAAFQRFLENCGTKAA